MTAAQYRRDLQRMATDVQTARDGSTFRSDRGTLVAHLDYNPHGTDSPKLVFDKPIYGHEAARMVEIIISVFPEYFEQMSLFERAQELVRVQQEVLRRT